MEDEEKPRRIRRIKRNVLNDMEHQFEKDKEISRDNESGSEASVHREDDEDDFNPLQKKIKKMKKRVMGKKNEDDFNPSQDISDDDSEFNNKKKAPKRKSNKRDGGAA